MVAWNRLSNLWAGGRRPPAGVLSDPQVNVRLVDTVAATIADNRGWDTWDDLAPHQRATVLAEAQGVVNALVPVICDALGDPIHSLDRLTIYANGDVTRGKAAAGAVHAALAYAGVPHGAVIVLGASRSKIEAECSLVVNDAGLTEVAPGTATAGILSP